MVFPDHRQTIPNTRNAGTVPMAWLQQQSSGIYDVCFRFGSRRLKKSTRTREFAKADRQRAQIEETIDANSLQRYVSLRSRESGKRGAPVSSATVRKAIATFRTLWRWARGAGLVSTQFPNQGLKYPLDAEAPPFLTRAEIERRIERCISPDDETILWGCLYLSTQELDSLLQLSISIAAREVTGFAVCGGPMCERWIAILGNR
jgi:site-specific recombinase XerD